jgi:universal stress protein A
VQAYGQLVATFSQGAAQRLRRWGRATQGVRGFMVPRGRRRAGTRAGDGGSLRERADLMLPKHILVPIDFSPGAEAALDYACELAGPLGAVVHLVHALGPVGELPLSQRMIEDLTAERLRALDELAAYRRGRVAFGAPIVEVADPRDLILAAAARVDADLIVMGTHGRRGLSRLVLGSVAEDVVRRAPCPVLAVRSTPEPRREDPSPMRAAARVAAGVSP